MMIVRLVFAYATLFNMLYLMQYVFIYLFGVTKSYSKYNWILNNHTHARLSRISINLKQS